MFEFFIGTMFPNRMKIQKIFSYKDNYSPKGTLNDSPFLLDLKSEKCKIKSTNFSYRKIILAPLFLITFLVFFIVSFNFIKGHYQTRILFNEMVELSRESYSEKYKSGSDFPDDMKHYIPYLRDSKTPSIISYIKSYYSGDFFSGTKYSIYLTLLLTLAFGYTLYITGKSVFIGPYPILVLDRKRNILYTWENKKVYVARYEDAGYAAPSNHLFIKLFTFNTTKNRLETLLFQPNTSVHSSLFLSEEYENNAFISFINTYMQQGRDAIANHDFESESLKFYFGNYDPPVDVEAQIAKTLNLLDKEKPVDA